MQPLTASGDTMDRNSSSNFSHERRKLLRGGAATLAGAAIPTAPGVATTLDGGSGPIRLIVPHAPGTTPDLAARLVGPRLTARVDRPVVIDNRPGASGLIGYEMVTKAPPDGSTLMITAASIMTLPLLYPNAPINVLDGFTPISNLCSTNFALVIHPSLPAGNFPQFLAYVRARPGTVDYASPGKGTFHHLWMEQMCLMAGLQMSHVAYKGASGAITDVLAGHVKTMFLPVHQAVPFQKEGKLRIMGVISATRDPNFPALDTLSASGLPGFNGEAWYALFGPKGMGAKLAADIQTRIQAVLAEPEIMFTLAKQGVVVKGSSTLELYTTMKNEQEKWARVVREGQLNIRAE